MKGRYPENKINIIGGGIIGAMEAYLAHLDAKRKNEQIKIVIHERYLNLKESTTLNIVPSLTPDEILSVVPRGQALFEKLGLLFSEPGGIRVDDATRVNDTDVSAKFKDQVKKYSEDEVSHKLRTQTLLELGKFSMDLWQKIYDDGDPELRRILEDSNFNPCREMPVNGKRVLHDGYRIDLIYDIPDAAKKAEDMKASYTGLGYQGCQLLTPAEVMKIDPSLKHFCKSNSYYDAAGERVWRNNAIALWRPGGCLDTQIFLPKFFEYLKKVMGKYENEKGEMKDCFRLQLGREVSEVIAVDIDSSRSKINGLKFFGNAKTKLSSSSSKYEGIDYVFCPGEAVGTLNKLGFTEPAYAGFAGPSLMLNIPVSAADLKKYAGFSHCMEVHQEGVVLAWQARIRNGKVFIGVGGTKAFYSDQRPHVDQDFALNRNLLQLNMINDVLPDFVSIALDRNTKGKKLTAQDLKTLEMKNTAARWVGVRAVAYDGFPTLGYVYLTDRKVVNARCTTHMGSGGVSFAPAAVFASRNAIKDNESNELINTVLQNADSRRRCV